MAGWFQTVVQSEDYQSMMQTGRKGTAVVGLLTVTVEEAEIVNRVFDLSHGIAGTAYHLSDHPGVSERVRIVHKRCPYQTNLVSQVAAGDIIEDFRPEYVIMIGTAGGRSAEDGLTVGDVVVADYLDYCGYWKYAAGKVLHRKLPHDHPSGHLLEQYVEPLRMSPDRWTHLIGAGRPDGTTNAPKLLVGGIVSGNTLYGDPDNDEQKRIMQYFEKAYAFEMEGYGLSLAVYKARADVHYNPQYLVVRGISDLVDKDAAQNQEVRKLWTTYAVAAAAAFVNVLLADLFQVRGHSAEQHSNMGVFCDHS